MARGLDKGAASEEMTGVPVVTADKEVTEEEEVRVASSVGLAAEGCEFFLGRPRGRGASSFSRTVRCGEGRGWEAG